MTVYGEHDESVHEAVARETARHKRVLLAFTALVVVPIAIGAYALRKAPTETEVVARNVTPVVADRVSARVTDDVVKRSDPVIRQTVAQRVETSVAPLNKNIATLKAAVQQTSAWKAAVQPRIDAIPELQTQVASLRVPKPQTNDAALRDQLDAAMKRISVMETELRDLQTRTKKLEDVARRPRPQ